MGLGKGEAMAPVDGGRGALGNNMNLDSEVDAVESYRGRMHVVSM